MTDKQLMQMAIAAMERSYSPYSGFRVGAALLSADGRVFVGCNIENAAYPLTVCAERCAMFKAVSEGAREFVALAVAGGREGELRERCSPCGSCRQVMAELCCGEGFYVLLEDGCGGLCRHTLDELLPLRFDAKDLRR